LNINALGSISVNTNSVSFGTEAAIIRFQMGFINRSIDRIVTALSGAGSDKVIPTYKQPNASKSLAPQRKSTVSRFDQYFCFK